jgi:hypothetical protein
MSFCRNTSQQMNIFDSIHTMSEWEKKRLQNSWAETFNKFVFPLINEDRFKVIYSDNIASRPNNPVNVYVGLLLLKSSFCQSDDDAIDSLIFDVRYQYALNTTSFEKQPISKNSLSNFRVAVYKYNEEHGVDLIQEEIENLAKNQSKILNINSQTIRMDSLMVSSSCKRLSRLEIIFSCVERMIQEANEKNPSLLPEKFNIYLQEGHHNDTIYRTQDKDVESKLITITKDALELFYLFKGTTLGETDDYKLLSRMVGDQTKVVGAERELKQSKEISPKSLQNPTDPDATYRRKGKTEGVGYTANVVESFDDNNRIITQYDLQPNVYSDQSFSADVIEKLGMQETKRIILIDGAYYSDELAKLAASYNIELVPTNLVGRRENTEKIGVENFDIDEESHTVKACPEQQEPISSDYKDGEYIARFDNSVCNQCQQKENCPVVKQKKSNVLKVTEKKINREKIKARMETDEYWELANKRAGVEGLPSVLRRKYNIDNLPIRGQVRSKVWLGLKIAAINFKRLVKGMRSSLKMFFLRSFSVKC